MSSVRDPEGGILRSWIWRRILRRCIVRLAEKTVPCENCGGEIPLRSFRAAPTVCPACADLLRQQGDSPVRVVDFFLGIVPTACLIGWGVGRLVLLAFGDRDAALLVGFVIGIDACALLCLASGRKRLAATTVQDVVVPAILVGLRAMRGGGLLLVIAVAFGNSFALWQAVVLLRRLRGCDETASDPQACPASAVEQDGVGDPADGDVGTHPEPGPLEAPARLHGEPGDR